MAAGVRRRRLAAGLTQAALAKRMGRPSVPHVSIARIELGTVKPSLDVLARLADALNCGLHDLIIERRPRGSRRS